MYTSEIITFFYVEYNISKKIGLSCLKKVIMGESYMVSHTETLEIEVY